MAVNWPVDVPWEPVAGVELASTAAGIRYRDRDDLVLFRLAPQTQVATVLTRNAFCAAPVHVVRRHQQQNAPRALIINAGNANAGTGDAGVQAALNSCSVVAQELGLEPNQVLPFSTGVIGESMPVEPFARALPGLAQALSPQGWAQAARAIMTTDTLPKLRSRVVQLSDGRRLVMTGMAKGAGMIKPDMATMLAFIATNAPLQEGWPAKLLQQAVAQSFNAITVDGDTSTNDACVLMATGQAGGSPLTPDSLDGQIFAEALTSLMVELAQGIVRDAEGATRFMEVRIEGARTEQEARQVAFTVAESPLVKTAAFAADPNWGRILAAIGRSGLESLDISGVHLWMDEVRLIAQGQPDPEYAEERGAAVAARPEYTIRAVLNRGSAMARVWTCDYSYDYVRINAEYRS